MSRNTCNRASSHRHRRSSSHFESFLPTKVFQQVRSALQVPPNPCATSRCVRSRASSGRLRSSLRMRSRNSPLLSVRCSGSRTQKNVLPRLRSFTSMRGLAGCTGGPRPGARTFTLKGADPVHTKMPEFKIWHG